MYLLSASRLDEFARHLCGLAVFAWLFLHNIASYTSGIAVLACLLRARSLPSVDGV